MSTRRGDSGLLSEEKRAKLRAKKGKTTAADLLAPFAPSPSSPIQDPAGSRSPTPPSPSTIRPRRPSGVEPSVVPGVEFSPWCKSSSISINFPTFLIYISFTFESIKYHKTAVPMFQTILSTLNKSILCHDTNFLFLWKKCKLTSPSTTQRHPLPPNLLPPHHQLDIHCPSSPPPCKPALSLPPPPPPPPRRKKKKKREGERKRERHGGRRRRRG